eukprot:gene5424-10866_t
MDVVNLQVSFQRLVFVIIILIPLSTINVESELIGGQRIEQVETSIPIRAIGEISFLREKGYNVKPVPSIMFWRPQKVGSSTFLSLLVSFGFRYNALPRRKGSGGLPKKFGKNSTPQKQYKLLEDFAESIPYKISLTHDLCNLESNVIAKYLPCAMNTTRNNLKEIILLREPISRALSVYYFWGELYKLSIASGRNGHGKRRKRSQLRNDNEENENVKENSNSAENTKNHKQNSNNNFNDHRKLEISSNINVILNDTNDNNHDDDNNNINNSIKRSLRKRKKSKINIRLGASTTDTNTNTDTDTNSTATGRHSSSSSSSTGMRYKGNFLYHGDEKTSPPEDIAVRYAMKLPYKSGMPGPSYTWSSIATSVTSAIQVLHSGRILPMITERLDESLIVARHHLGMSVADIIVTKPRKNLSGHPKYTAWPPSAVHILNTTLYKNGEIQFYEAANKILDERLVLLNKQGVNVHDELMLLKALRERVTDLCLSEEYLERYRTYLEQTAGLPQHGTGGMNRLRDTEDKFAEDGHCFSLNREILYSYDVCGGCEAHGILYSIENSGSGDSDGGGGGDSDI